MANDAKIIVEVVLKGGEGLTAGMTSAILAGLEKSADRREAAFSQIQGMEGIKNLPDQMALIANTFKGISDNQDQSEQRLFNQFKQSEANYLTNSPDYAYKTRGQQEARRLYEDERLNLIKTFEDVGRGGKSLSDQIRMFSENVKLSNKEMRNGNVNAAANKMNAFNLTELLMAASARAVTGVFTAQAGYAEGTLGTGGGALSNLKVSTDIAQRTAISTAIQTALPALGFAIGGLAGAGIGYALSLPAAVISAARSSAETQQLNLEQQSAIVNLYGGGSLSQNKKLPLPGSGFFGMDLLTANLNNRMAQLTSSGNGPLNTMFAASAMPFNRYRLNQSGLSNQFLSTLGALSASTGEDPSAIAQGIAYIAARTGQSPTDILTNAINLGSATGQTATDVLNQTTSLAQSTALGTVGNAQSFLRSTAPYGPAFQQTAIGYQGSGFQQKITMNALGQMFGLNVPGIMSGNSGSVAQFKHFINDQNKEGNIAGVGMGDILGQIMLQGPSNFYSVANAPNVSSGSTASANITPQQIQGNAPTAYQQAIHNARMEVNGKTTVIIKNAAMASFAQTIAGFGG